MWFVRHANRAKRFSKLDGAKITCKKIFNSNRQQNQIEIARRIKVTEFCTKSENKEQRGIVAANAKIYQGFCTKLNTKEGEKISYQLVIQWNQAGKDVQQVWAGCATRVLCNSLYSILLLVCALLFFGPEAYGLI